MSQNEIANLRLDDLFKYIKDNNIAALNGLIQVNNLDSLVMKRRSDLPTDSKELRKQMPHELVLVYPDRKVKTTIEIHQEWNPLVVAIAHRKAEIVKYFLNNMQVPLRFYGESPKAIFPDDHFFALRVAVSNRDTKILR